MFDNVLVVPCRWETNSLVEFCEYHKAVGFDHVYIYCNDDDPWNSYTVLRPYIEAEKPFVTFVHFGLVGQQRQMLLHWIAHYRHQARQVAFFDADEFLFMPGVHDIRRFLDRFGPDWDVLFFNWSCFGPGSHVRRPEGSVLVNYDRREPELHVLTKVLVRTELFSEEWLAANPSDVIWHGLSALYSRHRCRNVIHDDMATYHGGGTAAAYLSQPGVQEAIRQVAVLNHYSIKSEEDCIRRAQRSVSGDFASQSNWKALHDTGGFRALADKMNSVRDDGLRDYWIARLAAGRINAVAVAPAGANLALGRPATQSSVSDWSLGATAAEDASNAVDGRITGRHQFHTGLDDHAWWRVDLQAPVRLRAIRLFNRLDCARDRARDLRIEISTDGVAWRLLARTPADRNFGGADGEPFVWQGAETARYVMLSGQKTHLHLDQVEIYGDA